MNLDAMQDMLNELNAFFKVFVYPTESQIVLRVFHDSESWSNATGFRDIDYDLDGNIIDKEKPSC